jgi:hypothetical protein
MNRERAERVVAQLIIFLETGQAPDGLFTDDAFCDFTMPRWRVQALGRADVIGLRLRGHPGRGRVPHFRCDPTPTGFVLELEEEWLADGESWSCRELFRADLRGQSIEQLSVYCTGDWDSARRAEHQRQVQLLRP